MKKLKNVAMNVLAVVGAVVILAAAGTSDYMSAVGEYYPLTNTLMQVLFGCACLLPKVVSEFMIAMMEG